MLLYLKYGELVLKGGNRKKFTDLLHKNIRFSLRNFPSLSLKKEFDSFSIDNIDEQQFSEVSSIVQNISGISWIINAYNSSTDLEKLVEQIVSMLPKEAKSFRVDTKRQDKNFRLNSMEINAKVGEMILEKLPSYKVDLHKPQIKINIEIKYKKAIFYFEKIKGFGGFPIGIAGKVLMLISGGIDSPIAAKLLLKKGFIVDFITFITPPHTSPIALEKVEKLIKIISLNNSLYEPSLHVCNFTNLQNELSHMSDKTYQITIMRRYFFKIARDLALKEKCHAIATGESIGQVASQTIESMTTIQNAIGDFIVLRPLVTYDKNEIIDLAIKYKTYETSILPYADCCALFVPKNPVTKPSVLKAEKIEKNLELAEQVYQNILSKIVKKKCE